MGNGKSSEAESPPTPVGGVPQISSSPNDHVVGLENFGNTCYCNAVLQLLYQSPAVRAAILNQRRRKEDNHNLLTRLAQLFAQMDGSKRKSVVSPSNFVQTVRKMRVEFSGPQHQDAPEFLMYILNDIMELEKKSRAPLTPSGSNPKTLVEELFQGIQVTQTSCLSCDTSSDRKESFLQLSVDIIPNTSLTHCLRNYCRTENLSGPNKLRCDSCCALAEGRIRLHLSDMPKVLLIQLKRFRYCEIFQGHKKLSYRISFPTSKLCIGPHTYELRGVVIHQGSSTNVGHYFACIRTHPSGQWWLIDDDLCTKIDETDVHAYFGHSGASTEVRRGSSTSGGGSTPPPPPLHQPSSATVAYLLLYELCGADK